MKKEDLYKSTALEVIRDISILIGMCSDSHQLDDFFRRVRFSINDRKKKLDKELKKINDENNIATFPG